MAMLVTVDQVEFTVLRDQVNATDGNLSVHLTKLEEAGYITVKKQFIERKPASLYRMTVKGEKSFRLYIERLEKLIK